MAPRGRARNRGAAGPAGLGQGRPAARELTIGQLTRTGFAAAPAAALAGCAAAFSRSHFICLDDWLEPWLLDAWSRWIARGPYRARTHHDAGYWGGKPPADLVLDDPATSDASCSR